MLLADALERHQHLNWRGFTSVSIIENNQRVGWAFKGIYSTEGVLAHVDLASEVQMGRYGIDLGLFGSIVDAELDETQPADIYVIDEIGLISAMHPPFAQLLEACLDSKTPEIAIAREKSPEILGALEVRPHTKIARVGAGNVDAISTQIDDWITALP